MRFRIYSECVEILPNHSGAIVFFTSLPHGGITTKLILTYWHLSVPMYWASYCHWDGSQFIILYILALLTCQLRDDFVDMLLNLWWWIARSTSRSQHEVRKHRPFDFLIHRRFTQIPKFPNAYISGSIGAKALQCDSHAAVLNLIALLSWSSISSACARFSTFIVKDLWSFRILCVSMLDSSCRP
jgi:hypothetical protein